MVASGAELERVIAGQAKVEDFGAAVARHHDVFGLEIAMDDAGRVRGGEAVAICAARSSVLRTGTGPRG